MFPDASTEITTLSGFVSLSAIFSFGRSTFTLDVTAGSNTAGTTVNQAFSIDPVIVTNLFVNYTFQHPEALTKETKLQVGVTNLFNEHKIVGIASAKANSTSTTPNTADLLTVLPGRSINVTATTSF